MADDELDSAATGAFPVPARPLEPPTLDKMPATGEFAFGTAPDEPPTIVKGLPASEYALGQAPLEPPTLLRPRSLDPSQPPGWDLSLSRPPTRATMPAPPDANPAPVIRRRAPIEPPGYEILGELGRGGMGVVYKARQSNLGRLVALKMILAGNHADADDLARFKAEAEAIAKLQHPYIVQIYEIGEHDGRPFFSLEYCNGGSLAGVLAGTPLPPQQAAKLIQQLARGMQAAHDQQIIHRDLKPGNILLQGADGTADLEDATQRTRVRGPGSSSTKPTGLPDDPSSDHQRLRGTPKITDFGLAKKLDSAGPTASGTVLGTPSYMAPEQAAGDTRRLGPATDIYALGALLYECLTGRPPFRAETPLDTCLQVMNEDPVPPRLLNRAVPRDLEIICLKCLHKQPNKRYETANDLGDDLDRFRNGDAIAARPIGWFERAIKWTRRNPARALTLCTGGLAIVAIVLFTMYFTYQLNQEKLIAQAAQTEAVRAQSWAEEALGRVEQQLYVNRIQLADRAAEQKNWVQALQILASSPSALRGWEWRYLYPLCRAGKAGQAFAPQGWSAPHAQLAERPVECRGLAYSPDGQRLAIVSKHDARVRIHDVTTGQVQITLWVRGLQGQQLSTRHNLLCPVFSADGNRLVLSAKDGFPTTVWDVSPERTGGQDEPLATFDAPSDGETNALSADGRRVFVGSEDNWLRGYDLTTTPPKLLWDMNLQASVRSVVLSPDGKTLAVGLNNTAIRLFTADDAQPIGQFKGHGGTIVALRFSHDGKTLFSASKDRSVRIWSVEGRQLLRKLTGHTADIDCISLTADGKRLATSADDRTIRIWDVASGDELFSLRGVTEVADMIAFSPDGQHLAATARTQGVRIWAARKDAGYPMMNNASPIGEMAWFADGQHLASASYDGFVRIWDTKTGRSVHTIATSNRSIVSISVSPDGRYLAAATGDPVDLQEQQRPGQVRLWDLLSNKELFVWDGFRNASVHVRISPDSKRVVAADVEGQLRMWELPSGRQVVEQKHTPFTVLRVLFSPNGKYLASGTFDGRVIIRNAETCELLTEFTTDTKAVTGLAWSPDSEQLAVGLGTLNPRSRSTGPVRIWTRTGTLVQTLEGMRECALGLAFSPDGKRVAATDSLLDARDDAFVHVWSIAEGKRIACFTEHRPILFSVLSTTIPSVWGSTGSDGTIRFWHEDDYPVVDK
jgi:WD40 repeat protein/serine/threonine protein kinase